MHAMCGSKAFVTLEFQDGRTIQGQVVCASVTLEQDRQGYATFGDDFGHSIPGPLWWSMDLQGLGELTESLGEFEGKVNEKRQAPEWKCVYCGQANDKKEKRCVGCNGPRPFIFRDDGTPDAKPKDEGQPAVLHKGLLHMIEDKVRAWLG